MPDPISSGIGAAAGLAQTIAGIVNAGKTRKIARELERSRPEYEISELAGQDLDLAESELAAGMSSRAESAYNNLNNQQFASSLGAILRGGGSVNNVADLYGENQEGRTRIALLNDQLRGQQIDRLMKTRDMYRDEQDKAFEFNEWMPWADKSQANAAAREKAQNQIWGGIGTVANTAANFFGSQYQENQYDQYFGGGGNNAGGNGGVSSFWTEEYAPMTTSARPNISPQQFPYLTPGQPAIQPQQMIPMRAPQYNFPQYNQMFYGG